jgi:ribosomal protein S18 acetylase RimI-like enzyme
MTMAYRIIEWDSRDLEGIRSTWERLTQHHEKTSTYFASYFSDYPFEVRKKKLALHAEGGSTKIDLVIDEDTDQVVGHCISIIGCDGKGELESIYIDPKVRETGIGKDLVNRAATWFEDLEITEFEIEVAVGNEEVLGFYEKFGYKPFSYNLKKV